VISPSQGTYVRMPFSRARDGEATYAAPDRHPWCHSCPSCKAPAQVLCMHFRHGKGYTIHRRVCPERY
jgi:hypothetical protein